MVESQLIPDPSGSNVNGHSYMEISKQISKKYPSAQFNEIIKDGHGNGIQLDTIISHNGKNVYVIYKGKDVLPATPLDVHALSYIRSINMTSNKNNNMYAILCERPDTPSTSDIAKKKDIGYYKDITQFHDAISKYLNT